MGKRKVSILGPAVTAGAEIGRFIENKGMQERAKKFVDKVFQFFDSLTIKQFSN